MKHAVFIVFLVFGILASLGAHAANRGSDTCGSIDTQTNSITSLLTLQNVCTFTTGPSGIVYATWAVYTTCTGTPTVQLFVIPGPGPGAGSAVTFGNPLGSIAGGTLTVTGMVPGTGANILSGTYNSGTGAVSLTIDTGAGFSNGETVTVSGLSGTDAVLNGPHTNGGTTGSTTVTFTVATGQSITIGSGGSVVHPPYMIQPGQHLTGPDMVGLDGVTVTGYGTTGRGGTGTYSISYAGSVTFNPNGEFTLSTVPAGAIAITPVMHQTGCNPNFVITELTGVFSGAPNAQYWLAVAIGVDVNTHIETWNNSQATIFTH